MSYSVGLIGAGYFSRFHIEAWDGLPGTTLVGIADLDLERVGATGHPAFSDPAEMLEATRPDIIDIAAPPGAHADLIRLALSHRPSAIICQKPFCTSRDEARTLAEEAEAEGVPLVVHENFRFQPWYRAMRDAIEDESLGRLHRLTFTLRTGDGQGPTAYLDRPPYFQTMPRLLIHETGVHWVDTFRFLLGRPDAVDADLQRMNPVIKGEDAGRFTFRYADGLRATFDGNRCLDAGAENPRLTFGTALLEGEEASLRLSTDGALHRRSFGARHETEVLRPHTGHGFAGDCVTALQAHVVAALNGTGPWENLALDYLEVLEIEEAIYRADETGSVQELD